MGNRRLRRREVNSGKLRILLKKKVIETLNLRIAAKKHKNRCLHPPHLKELLFLLQGAKINVIKRLSMLINLLDLYPCNAKISM